MQIIKSSECVMGVCGTPTSIVDVMGAACSVGDRVMLMNIDSDGRVMWSSRTYIADGSLETFSNGVVTCDGVVNAYVMGIRSIDTNKSKDWIIKKMKYGRLSSLTGENDMPYRIEETDHVEFKMKNNWWA